MHYVHTKIISLALVALISAQLAPLSTFAAQSTFTTSLTTFGTDVTAPTVPTGLTATPVSSSQIDLSWTASTDDFTVTGYRIYRDSVYLTTISGTSYSDTGLSASTTYSYTVEAVDQSNNMSGQSNPPVSATTFGTVVVTPVTPPSGPGSGGITLLIYNVSAVPQEHQAVITFDTNVSAQTKVYWGKTHEYEIGSMSALFYGKHHEVSILGLESGATYYAKIEATDIRGFSKTQEVAFTTLSPQVFTPLANPSDFKAIPFDTYIQLSWLNPIDTRFDQVRVVRSDTFFPRDPNDGVPIYEGRAEAYKDTDVRAGTTYYYALFARDSSGAFSSGALAQARIVAQGEIALIPGKDPFESIPDATHVDPIIAELTLADFDFIQQGRLLINVGNETIAINGGVPLTIRLKYDKVPEILKTIAFSLVDPEDATKSFPFLLRVNADKTYYTATIGALGRSGNYTLNIVVLDYQNQGLKRIHGTIRALVFGAPADIRRGFDPFGFLILILLILILLLLMSRRECDDEQPRKVLPNSLDLSNTQKHDLYK